MDKLWKVVNAYNLKNKGLNSWVYEPNEMVFAGVELDVPPNSLTGLEQKKIILNRYAYYKHVGSYRLLNQVGRHMRNELKNRNIETRLPHLEIYGHWTNEEAKLETELFMCIE